jgi:putative SOS response-associated peptidase YedK
MCGRFTLTRKDFRALAAELDAVFDDDIAAMYKARYNIAPTDQHWIVREKREQRDLLPARFGLANSWAKDAKGAARQINARSETVHTARAFRDAFERRRCVIPADGFFEWTGTKEARRPVWFHPPDDSLILFAGIYESWKSPEGDWMRTFAILTTEPNDVVRPVHDRMPVILPKEQIADWMYQPPRNAEVHVEKLHALLKPAPNDALVPTEVSVKANSVKNDDPSVLEPARDREPVQAPRLF